MPWTRKQVKLLLSSGSPLSSQQKGKMKQELHQDPSMGHKKKGSKALKPKVDMRPHPKSDSHAFVGGRRA